MKQTLVLILLFISLLPITLAQQLTAKPQGGNTKELLVQMEKDWAEATIKGAATAYDRILADDFISTSARGLVRNKAENIEGLRNDSGLKSINLSEMVVREYGDTAVLTGRALAKGEEKQSEYSLELRVTDTFVKREGRWKCVANHLSLVGPPRTQQNKQ